ncbi:DUF2093 domain-containing protein [Sphingomonas sp. BIUV-7]|uniref:DUF2093 domain-containing protein n=1 Tax=Sphingomonas natans TaxID=3063330 RepID=A0ABT8YF25_9SPHN|nr:DUF2093 domain-containing protein [Sphingomonas sp. BIUV-7]MDO6416398.1 DUF2093 domain-containing protein [Sphingomonas sp. BIUV-7]
MLMAQGRPARLHYMANNFRVLAAGDHVVCAQSGARVSLEELRYWSVLRQEPYATCELSTRAEHAA